MTEYNIYRMSIDEIITIRHPIKEDEIRISCGINGFVVNHIKKEPMVREEWHGK